MPKLTREQSEEIAKCAADFPYFCEQYVKIYVTKGANTEIQPFKLHPYQVRLYEHVEDNRFSIFSKFRQGGFTTELAIYGLWKCLFRLDQRVLWLSQSDRASQDVCDRIVKRVIDHLPEWMKGNVMKMTNSHQKSFPDTDSAMQFYTPEAACGKSVSLLIVDEASFIKDMTKHWKAMWPCLSTGGSAIVLSTPNYDDDWFWQTMEDAALKLNSFAIYRCNYKERPEHCDPQWEMDAKNNLGQKGWEVEYEQKPMERVQIEKTSRKPSKKLWRSIWDEWDSSSSLDERGLEGQ